MILNKDTSQFILDVINNFRQQQSGDSLFNHLFQLKLPLLSQDSSAQECISPFPWEWNSFPLHILPGPLPASHLMYWCWSSLRNPQHLCCLVAFNTVPNLFLRKLWHPPSNNLALEAHPSFTGIRATSSSVQIIFRLYSCKKAIPRFTLWLSPCITRGSRT